MNCCQHSKEIEKEEKTFGKMREFYQKFMNGKDLLEIKCALSSYLSESEKILKKMPLDKVEGDLKKDVFLTKNNDWQISRPLSKLFSQTGIENQERFAILHELVKFAPDLSIKKVRKSLEKHNKKFIKSEKSNKKESLDNEIEMLTIEYENLKAKLNETLNKYLRV